VKVSQAERGERDRETPLLVLPRFERGVEECSGGEAGRIPPHGRGVVGDGREGAAHALRTNADSFGRLGKRWPNGQDGGDKREER
jgi:hypothetical protein